MKYTCSTRKCCVGTQRNLYSTGWRWGFASGETQILAFSDTNMLVYFALGNAKFWRRVHCPTPTPDARYFAFWWNIGFNHFFSLYTLPPASVSLTCCISIAFSVLKNVDPFDHFAAFWFPLRNGNVMHFWSMSLIFNNVTCRI